MEQAPFPSYFNLLNGKLLCTEITLLFYFPAKFSRKFNLSLSFPANDRKPNLVFQQRYNGKNFDMCGD
jgi:hypothetical protein